MTRTHLIGLLRELLNALEAGQEPEDIGVTKYNPRYGFVPREVLEEVQICEACGTHWASSHMCGTGTGRSWGSGGESNGVATGSTRSHAVTPFIHTSP